MFTRPFTRDRNLTSSRRRTLQRLFVSFGPTSSVISRRSQEARNSFQSVKTPLLAASNIRTTYTITQLTINTLILQRLQKFCMQPRVQINFKFSKFKWLTIVMQGAENS